MIDDREIVYGEGVVSASINIILVNNSSSTIELNGEFNFEFQSPDPVSGIYFAKNNDGTGYTGTNRIDKHGKFSTSTVSIAPGITLQPFTTTPLDYFNAGHSYSQNGAAVDWDGKRHLATQTTPVKSRHYISGADLYKVGGTGLHDLNLTVTVTPQNSEDNSNGTICITNGHTYTFTITDGNNKVGGNDSESTSTDTSSSSTTTDNDSDTYSKYPFINPAGWETYGKGKRAELMYASIIPSCTDSCFFMTKYFEFGGITNKPVTLYYIKDNPSESTAKRYVFYEISEADYNSGINGNDKEHFYRIDGVFGGLGIVNYSFNNNTSERNGKIDGHQYLGTTSEPDYMINHISKGTLYRLLKVVQEVGDTAGRQPTYGLNWGRVRPLGNTDTNKEYRQPNTPIGNPFNGFSNNTLKARFTDYNDEFKRSIGSDEVHADGPTSWPSGHSSQCWAMAMTVVQLLGLKYHINNGGTSIIDEICKYVHKAYKFGVLRTIGRFHWNSDTMYGKIFGSLIMPVLNASYDNGDAAQSFNELFALAYKDLYPNDTISYKTLNPITYKDGENVPNEHSDWFDDFKELLREIGQKANIANIIWEPGNKDDKIFGYLWDIYKIGRSELESNTTKIFEFFSGDNFNVFYPDGDDKYYFDEDADDIVSEWHNCRSWFPEVFPNGHSQDIQLLESDTSKVPISYHGTNTNYNVSGLTNIKILCSWLMAFCIAELNISECTGGKPTENNISNQTKIFATAYNICGARNLKLYDNYEPSHDPTYLRLLAGIIYCFCRGQYNPDDIHGVNSIGTGICITLDTEDNDQNTPDVIGVLNKDEANANIGNTASKALNSEGWNDAVVKYGIDNYYIFPNAPGPYIPGRKFSKPYESNSSKPGNSETVQPKDQFIVPEVKIVDTSDVVYSGYESPIVTSFIPNDSSSNSPEGEKLYSVGLISDLHLNYQENFDSTQTDAEGLYYDEDDLAKILQIFKEKNVEFICGCGDITESRPYYQDKIDANNIYDSDGYKIPLLSKSAPHYAIYDDAQNFYNIYTKYSNGLKFYTPLGNHDFWGLFEALATDTINSGNTANEYANGDDNKGFNESVHNRIKDIWFKYVHCPEVIGSNENIHYFRYNNNYGGSNLSGWLDGDHGAENYYSKLNFWFEKELSNGKKDRYVFMSIDYGNDKFKGGGNNHDWHDRKIKAREKIDPSKNDIYINKMFELVGTAYDNTHDKYNYQFYHPNVLIWLYEILISSENDDNINNVYVFSHHFLPHKVGNNIDGILPSDGEDSGWGYGSANPDTVENNSAYNIGTYLNIGDNKIREGATYLSGIEFLFINYLNNEYKKSIFFSGHSHISWKNENSEASHITYGKDYDYDIQIDQSKAKLNYIRSSNTAHDIIFNGKYGGKWVALPSTCKPCYGNEENRQPKKGSYCQHRDEAEFTIMDVYSNGIQLSGYNMVRS